MLVISRRIQGNRALLWIECSKEVGAILQLGARKNEVSLDLIGKEEADTHINQDGGCLISFVIWAIFMFCLCSGMIRLRR